MSASKSPVCGPKSDPTDGDPEEFPLPVSAPPALDDQHPEPRLGFQMFRGPWALSVGPEQIRSDIPIDHSSLQTEAHQPDGSGLGRNRQAIARIEAQARIKRYFVQHDKETPE